MSKKQSDNRYTPASYKQANSSGSATKSLKSKKAMIISLIAIVAVAVIVVSLVLALWKEVIPSNIESTRPTAIPRRRWIFQTAISSTLTRTRRICNIL